MKAEGTHAALEQYKRVRAPEDHRPDRELPDDVGVVHAYRGFDEAKPGLPRFAEWYEKWHAACGWRVRVLLPQKFDTDDPSACEKCALALFEADSPASP